MFLRCIEDIRKVKFDLIICDEAHRLKNSAIKTATAITGLSINKRILLTGTPIQNNLQEFYTLAEMANPGIFGSLAGFKRIFIEPITRSQQPNCDEDEKEIGTVRAEELGRLTKSFCLRRTADINKAYLPTKVEHVVFVRISPLQETLYKQLLKSQSVRSCLTYSYNGSQHLVCIGALKKLCNDPQLLYQLVQNKENLDDEKSIYEGLLPYFTGQYSADNKVVLESSSKLQLMRYMLESFAEKDEKVVIVSNSTKVPVQVQQKRVGMVSTNNVASSTYTSLLTYCMDSDLSLRPVDQQRRQLATLDILQEFCRLCNYKCVRLDGQTQVAARQQMVDRFNDRTSDLFIFLLSSKAGGVGLNLTGASRLILYDIDWNPANDMQSMARVWRDGQKKVVHTYRLLIADLFSYKETDTCSTHELLQCDCLAEQEGKKNSAVTETTENVIHGYKKKSITMAELMKWEHIWDYRNDKNLDDGLRACPVISFVLRNVSN